MRALRIATVAQRPAHVSSHISSQGEGGPAKGTPGDNLC